MSIGLCFTSDNITLDQNWHLFSHSAGGKDLSNDTQIRVIGIVASEVCMKMLRNSIVKLGAKLRVATSWDNFSVLCMLSLNLFFELEASPVEDQSQAKR